MTPEDELAGLLPAVSRDRELPRRDLHKARLMAAVADDSARPRPFRLAPFRAIWRRPAAGRWLVPVSAAVAVAVVAVAAVTLSSTVFGRTASSQLAGKGRTPAGPAPAGKLTTARHWQLSAAGLRGVVLRTNSGSITVAGGTAGRAVAITARPSYQGAAPVVSSTVAGGVLTVSAMCPGSSGSQSSCTVTVQVSLPRSVPVRASTDLGNVDVANLAGSVAVTDQLGAIGLSGLAGPVTAVDYLGDIHGHGLRSQTVKLSAQVGSIDVAFSAPPDSVYASDQTGSVAITVPLSVSYRVAANAQVGASTVTVPQAANSAHVIIASTQVGSVTVAG